MDDEPTAAIPVHSHSAPDSSTPRRYLGPALVAAAIFGLLVLVYVVDLVTSRGDVPRGVVVAGVDVGGVPTAEAEALLHDRLGGRAGEPIPFVAGDVQGEITVPPEVLDVDWEGTAERIGEQPLNPFTRIASLFTTRDVDVAAEVDDAALTAKVEELRPQVDRPTVDGSIVFEGAKPIGLTPVAGQALDVPGAVEMLTADWAEPGPVELPVTVTEGTVDSAAVDEALQQIALPAVSGDVVVKGKNGKSAVLRPDQVGAVLGFAPADGALEPQYNVEAAIGILAPQLAETEIRPKDASFTLGAGAPVVVPSQPGDMIDWPKTLETLPDLLAASEQREADAVYAPAEPALTTEAAEGLGITEVIGEFTTGGFEYASGVNIRKVASVVNGAVVKPGDTFSLNTFTGPRGIDQGYVESGIIDHGRPSKAVGGGISQFATTLYNATYFAGLEDAGHTEHSYYISRYPEAREATVFEGAIDLAFRNNTEHGVVIEAVGTESEVTVRIWGTREVDVESETGERSAETRPDTITLPNGPDCVPSSGASGFTTSNTRIIRDHATGDEISRHTRTVKYDPIPIVKCE